MAFELLKHQKYYLKIAEDLFIALEKIFKSYGYPISDDGVIVTDKCTDDSMRFFALLYNILRVKYNDSLEIDNIFKKISIIKFWEIFSVDDRILALLQSQDSTFLERVGFVVDTISLEDQMKNLSHQSSIWYQPYPFIKDILDTLSIAIDQLIDISDKGRVNLLEPTALVTKHILPLLASNKFGAADSLKKFEQYFHERSGGAVDEPIPELIPSNLADIESAISKGLSSILDCEPDPEGTNQSIAMKIWRLLSVFKLQLKNFSSIYKFHSVTSTSLFGHVDAVANMAELESFFDKFETVSESKSLDSDKSELSSYRLGITLKRAEMEDSLITKIDGVNEILKNIVKAVEQDELSLMGELSLRTLLVDVESNLAIYRPLLSSLKKLPKTVLLTPTILTFNEIMRELIDTQDQLNRLIKMREVADMQRTAQIVTDHLLHKEAVANIESDILKATNELFLNQTKYDQLDKQHSDLESEIQIIDFNLKDKKARLKSINANRLIKFFKVEKSISTVDFPDAREKLRDEINSLETVQKTKKDLFEKSRLALMKQNEQVEQIAKKIADLNHRSREHWSYLDEHKPLMDHVEVSLLQDQVGAIFSKPQEAITQTNEDFLITLDDELSFLLKPPSHSSSPIVATFKSFHERLDLHKSLRADLELFNEQFYYHQAFWFEHCLTNTRASIAERIKVLTGIRSSLETQANSALTDTLEDRVVLDIYPDSEEAILVRMKASLQKGQFVDSGIISDQIVRLDAFKTRLQIHEQILMALNDLNSYQIERARSYAALDNIQSLLSRSSFGLFRTDKSIRSEYILRLTIALNKVAETGVFDTTLPALIDEGKRFKARANVSESLSALVAKIESQLTPFYANELEEDHTIAESPLCNIKASIALT